MKILFLDDNKNRWLHFVDNNNEPGVSLHWAKTAYEAIHWLERNTYDIVSLDHDLGDEIMVASGDGTGYEVAQWIANNLQDNMPIVVLHTWNPAGAQNMKNILPNAIISRFAVAN